ncbi:MAG: hypothetical protein QM783_11150 [Phycisphaerales bacterium]
MQVRTSRSRLVYACFCAGAISAIFDVRASSQAGVQPAAHSASPLTGQPAAEPEKPRVLTDEERAFVGRWSVDKSKLEQSVRDAVKGLDEPKRSEAAMGAAEFATVTSFDIRDDGTAFVLPEGDVLPWVCHNGELFIGKHLPSWMYKVKKIEGGVEVAIRTKGATKFVTVPRGKSIVEADYRGEWEVDHDASLAANDKQLERWFACAPGLSQDIHDRIERLVHWQVKQFQFKYSLDAKIGIVSMPQLAPTPVKVEIVDDTVILSGEPQPKNIEAQDDKKLKPLSDFKMALRRDGDHLIGMYDHTTFVFKKTKIVSPENTPAEKPEAKTPAVQK